MSKFSSSYSAKHVRKVRPSIRALMTQGRVGNRVGRRSKVAFGVNADTGCGIVTLLVEASKVDIEAKGVKRSLDCTCP